MRRDEAEKLLGGYATGTLSPAERKLLFDAALEDQQLFESLADEEALRAALADPAARRELLDVLAPAPAQPEAPRAAWAWLAHPWRWALAGGLAAAVAIVVWAPKLVEAPGGRAQMARLSEPAEPGRPWPPASVAEPQAASPGPAAPAQPGRTAPPAPAAPSANLEADLEARATGRDERLGIAAPAPQSEFPRTEPPPEIRQQRAREAAAPQAESLLIAPPADALSSRIPQAMARKSAAREPVADQAAETAPGPAPLADSRAAIRYRVIPNASARPPAGFGALAGARQKAEVSSPLLIVEAMAPGYVFLLERASNGVWRVLVPPEGSDPARLEAGSTLQSPLPAPTAGATRYLAYVTGTESPPGAAALLREAGRLAPQITALPANESAPPGGAGRTGAVFETPVGTLTIGPL